MKRLVRRAAQRAHRFWVSVSARRADYERVWDSVSASASDARHAVAGELSAAEWERSGEATAADVATETRVGSTDTVLEIGCGAGRVGAHLATRCGRWIGADISAKMLGHAREALRHLPNVELIKLDGRGLRPLPASSVDVVYCTAVFMHLEEWDRYRYVIEAHRVLRPGGRLYVDNVNLLGAHGWKLFAELSRLAPADRPPHISKVSTPQELGAYARRAGFIDVHLRAGELFVTLIARKAPHTL